MQDIRIEVPHIDGTPQKTRSTPYRTPASSTATPPFW